MAFPQGIAFRATSGFVTDGTHDYGEIATNANYPTTSTQGNTVGWEQSPGGGTRDRNNTFDPRISGIIFVTSPTTLNYRIDLPAAGAYKVRLGAGDASGNSAKIELFDSASTLGVLVPGAYSTNFYDATDTAYTSAAWPAGNSPVSKTFTTTICRFRLGDSTTSGVNYAAAYFYIEAASGGATATITEAASGTDSASATVQSAATVTEPATGSDSSTASGPSTAAQTDAASATDAQSASAQATATLNEAASGVDSSTQTTQATAAQTETTSATDSSTASTQPAATQTEAAVGTDAASASTQATAAINEPATGSDAPTASGSATAAVTEPASAGDTSVGAQGGSRAQTEAASASDASSAVLAFYRALTEPASASDVQQAVAALAGSVTDAASALDVSSALAQVVAQITESATALDTSQVTTGYGVQFDPHFYLAAVARTFYLAAVARSFYIICTSNMATPFPFAKDPRETRILTFDATADLPSGATLTGITSTTITVTRGIDANPSSSIGTPVINSAPITPQGTNVSIAADMAVQVPATGGIDGCWYEIAIVCTTNAAPTTITLKGVLRVTAS